VTIYANSATEYASMAQAMPPVTYAGISGWAPVGSFGVIQQGFMAVSK